MFIIQLRGAFGFRIQLTFFVLTLTSFLFLYFSETFVTELSVWAATLVSYYFLLRYIRRNSSKLEYAEGVNDVVLLPQKYNDIAIVSTFNLIWLLPLPYAMGHLLDDVGFTALKSILIAFCYFGGSFGAIGIINLCIQIFGGNSHE